MHVLLDLSKNLMSDQQHIWNATTSNSCIKLMQMHHYKLIGKLKQHNFFLCFCLSKFHSAANLKTHSHFHCHQHGNVISKQFFTKFYSADLHYSLKKTLKFYQSFTHFHFNHRFRFPCMIQSKFEQNHQSQTIQSQWSHAKLIKCMKLKSRENKKRRFHTYQIELN
jgi:hypothetical protein